MINKIFYGWWIVLACFFISFYVGCVVFFGITAFFEPLVKEFGWSYTQISLASSLRGLEMGLFAPIFGFLVDRFGSRKLILLGTVTIGVGLLLFSQTRSLVMFYLAFLFLALGAGGCTSVVLMAVLANWFRKNIGKAMGLMASGFGASGLIVPFVVYLIDVYHWRSALIILGLGMWVVGIPLSFIIRDRPEQYGFSPDGAVPENPIPHHEIQQDEGEVNFKEAIKERSFFLLNLAEASRMMVASAVILHVMPYLGSLGISRPIAGLVAAGIPLFSIIGRLSFGWLGDEFDKRYVMALAYCLMGTGMAAFYHIHEGWIIFLFLLLFPSGLGGSMVLRGAIVREYFGRRSFGKMIGIIMGAGSIGGIIGPTFAGGIFDALGSYHFVWLVFCGVLGLAMVPILRMKRLMRHGDNRSPV
jgi:MFS family permease